MKAQLNHRWSKGDSEIHLFRKMSDILSANYDTLFIRETHQRRISYHSETINHEASRELSDLWIIAYSPRQKRVRTTYLQAKYHRKNILPHGVFKGDYFQYELLAHRPILLHGGAMNFPLDVLSGSCCDSVGSYGIFYIEDDGFLNLAYCCASNLSFVEQPTTYGQFSINLSFPDDPQGIKFCKCFTCAEFNYTFEIDTFTDHLLQLHIGEELVYNYPGLIFLRNFFMRNITGSNVSSLINTIDDIVGGNNNTGGDDDFFKSEGGNPNILLINVDKK